MSEYTRENSAEWTEKGGMRKGGRKEILVVRRLTSTRVRKEERGKKERLIPDEHVGEEGGEGNKNRRGRHM